MAEVKEKRSLIDKCIHSFSDLVSSKKLFLYIVTITAIWILWNRFAPRDRFDDALQGYPYLVLIYTIWFAWVEGIMKVVQAGQQKDDEAKQVTLDKILTETHSQTKVIHNLVKIQLVLGKRTLEILESYSRIRDEREKEAHELSGNAEERSD